MFCSRSLPLRLIILLLAALPGCSPDGPSSQREPESDASRPFALNYSPPEELLSHPGYAAAKASIDSGEWADAEDRLRRLTRDLPGEAAVWNDLGYVLLQRDRVPAAMEAFERAIETNPRYERAQFNLGISHSRMDDEERARAAYLAALELNPFYYEAAFNLGLIAFKSGDLEAAREAFTQITTHTRSAEFAEAHYQLGLIAARLGDYRSAVEAYEACLLLNPAHVPSYVNVGAAYLNLKLPAMALERLEIGRRLAADNRRLNWNLAMALTAMERDEEAETILRAVIAGHPDYAPAYVNLATILMRKEAYSEARPLLEVARSLDPENASVHWNLAQVDTRLDRGEAAMASYRKVLELEPQRAEAYLNLAVLQMREGALERADYSLRQALQLDPEDERIQWNLGLLAARRGNDAAAIRHFRDLLERTPNHAEAALNLSAALMRQGAWDDAVEVIQEAIGRDATDFRHYWNLSLCHQALDQPRAQREALMETLRLNDSHQEALYNLGLLYFADAAYPKAKDVFHRAAYQERNTVAAKAFYMLGKCESEMGQYNAAISAYEKALDIRSDYAEASYNLALNLERTGDTGAAVSLYQKLVREDLANPEVLNNLALFYLDKGEYAEAVALLSKAVAMDSSYAKGWYNLGLAYMKEERMEAAEEAFETAVKEDAAYFAAWKNLGIARARAERYSEALSAMQEAFLLNPADGDTAVYIVKYLKLLDRPEEEMTAIYTTAYENGVRNPLLLRHLAKAASGVDDEMAVRYYEAYLDLRPTAPYFYNLGLALRRLERFPEAKQAYQSAVQADPAYKKAWVNLGYIHAYLGETGPAEEAFSKALAIDPAYENAQSALDALKNGSITP